MTWPNHLWPDEWANLSGPSCKRGGEREDVVSKLRSSEERLGEVMRAHDGLAWLYLKLLCRLLGLSTCKGVTKSQSEPACGLDKLEEHAESFGIGEEEWGFVH